MTKAKKPLFHRLVVANDRLDGLDTALPKAALIEHYSGAAIDVVSVIYDTIAEEPAKVLPPAEQANLIEQLKGAERNGLRLLVEPYGEKIAEIEAHVLWNKSAAAGILAELEDADFLIKPISRHQPLLDRLHAPLDWALMRSSPCPVLISKQPWSETRLVLAALDAGDESHQALNRAILATATDLSRILGCELEVVAAYPSLGQTVNELQVAMDYDGIKEDMRKTRETFIAELIDELDADVAEVHLLEGSARDAIPELANRLEATLTVLGNSARRGLTQLILGNTAEAIIGAIEGDLVTVREPA
ncbi:MAG: universal stress protein [Gammaproteobacteria bacterium]|jgi:universal stress protein E